MNRRLMAWSGVGVVALGAVGGGAWILSLPPAPPSEAPSFPGRSRRDADGVEAAERQRPLIAIVGINDATEVTDYLMPYGILRRADVADVVALPTEPGPVKLIRR